MALEDNIAKYIMLSRLHGVPYELYFTSNVFLDNESLDQFSYFYRIKHLPKILPVQKDTVIMVLETATPPGIHGQVVAAIAEQSAKPISSSVRVVLFGVSINPAYRALHEPETNTAVTSFMKSQTAAVINTSINWHNQNLVFKYLTDPHNDLYFLNSFIVDSAGNDGLIDGTDLGSEKLPNSTKTVTKKHNEVSILPPYVVSVGAATRAENGEVTVEGYSSANSPSILGIVQPEVKVRWRLETFETINDPKDKNHQKLKKIAAPKEPIMGTSAAAPYVSACLAGLYRRFGAYVNKEHILFAVFATCDKVNKVTAFVPKTLQDMQLNYIENSRGLSYNPLYAGFGLINVDKAFNLLSHIVNETQKDKTSLTNITDQKFIDTKNKGRTEYTFNLKEGVALKTTITAEFEDEYGSLTLVSPSGTTIPLILSRLKIEDKKSGLKELASGMTHAFAGESTKGAWKIISTEPISQISLDVSSFRERDIIKNIDIKKCSEQPFINFQNVLSLQEQQISSVINKNPYRGKSNLTIVDIAPNFDEKSELIDLLYCAPVGIDLRSTNRTILKYRLSSDSNAGVHEINGNKIINENRENFTFENFLNAFNNYQSAAKIYHSEYQNMEAANCYSLAALSIKSLPRSRWPENIVVSDLGVAVLEKAIDIHLKQNHFEFAHRDLNLQYDFLNQSIDEYKSQNNITKVNELLVLSDELQYQIYKISKQMQGTLDFDAERVEQGGMSFSSHIKFGTDNVNQSLVLIAKNPDTGFVGLCSFQHGTNLSSIDKFINTLATPDVTLKMRVFGSRFIGNESSKQNVVEVLNRLEKHGTKIDIISSDVFLGGDSPSAVVVEPLTFEIFELVPMKESKNNFLSNAKLFIQNVDENLHLSNGFEFLVPKGFVPAFFSKKVFPVEITRENLKQFNENFANKDNNEIYNYLKDNNYNEIAISTLYLKHMAMAVSKHQSELSNLFEIKLEELKIKGFKFNPENASNIKNIILNKPFWVGEGSSQKNEPIFNAISDEKIFIKNGKRLNFDLSIIYSDNFEKPANTNQQKAVAKVDSPKANALFNKFY